ELKYVIRPPAGLPPGYPVLRYESGGLAQVDPSRSAGRKRVVEFVDITPRKDNVEDNVNVEINLKSVAVTRNFVRAELWHRGHKFIHEIDPKLFSEPSSIWIYHPPVSNPRFAVRAGPELQIGAVAIVLDWSRSMNKKKDGDSTKYDQAVKALNDVLDSLP